MIVFATHFDFFRKEGHFSRLLSFVHVLQVRRISTKYFGILVTFYTPIFLAAATLQIYNWDPE